MLQRRSPKQIGRIGAAPSTKRPILDAQTEWSTNMALVRHCLHTFMPMQVHVFCLTCPVPTVGASLGLSMLYGRLEGGAGHRHAACELAMFLCSHCAHVPDID